jgi:hypothetical protein
METSETIKRYQAMRAAFRAFGSADELEARKALQAANVIGFSENLQLNSAFRVVRAFLEKLDQLGN